MLPPPALIPPVIVSPSTAVPAWRKAIPKGKYGRIPSINPTTADSAADTGSGPTLASGLSYYSIPAYNGLAVDVLTGKIYMVGPGGHGDGSCNVTIGCDLMQDEPQWATVVKASLDSMRNWDSNGFYLDGALSATHGYYTHWLIHALSKIFRFGCRATHGSGNGHGNRIAAVNLLTGTYDAESAHPLLGDINGGVSDQIIVKVANEDVFMQFGSILKRWDREADKVIELGTDASFIGHGNGAAYDDRRNRIFCPAMSTRGVAGPFVRDMATHVATRFRLTGVDERALPWGPNGCAVVFDEKRDRYLVTNRNLAGDVYGVDADSGKTALAYTNDTGTPIPTSGGGWYTRFSEYIAPLGGHVLIADGGPTGAWFLATDDI